MVSVRIQGSEALVAELWEAGTAGIMEGDGFLEAFFEDRAAATRFGEPQPVAETNWVQRTKDAWPPLLIGERFFVAAPWRSEPTPAGRLRLEINPGLAWGTGQHPSTQLCLEAMERGVRPGDAVLDVGTGSGILAKAAILLGAGWVAACDIDPEVRLAGVPFFTGSAEAVRAGAFDVVVANISAEAIAVLRPELERVARRRILSGFTDQRGAWTCEVY